MRIDIFNIDQFVKENDSPQITNPVYFSFDGSPTPDGLFSYELFGVSEIDRKNIFGYVDLGGKYIHPSVYSILSTRMGSLQKILSEEKYATIGPNGKLIVHDKKVSGSGTGAQYIYDNFSKIKWFDEIDEEELDSVDKKTRLKFLESLDRDEFFVSKWLILPPFYHEVNTKDKTGGDEINKLYRELISRTNSMKQHVGIELYGKVSRQRIQAIIMALYGETTRMIRGKNSMFRKSLLGKTVDYSASNVITSPPITNANTPEDMPVPFGYGSFPMATALTLFHPFVVHRTIDSLEIIYSVMESRYHSDIASVITRARDVQDIEKNIKRWITSTDNRFEPLKFEYKNHSGDTVEVYYMIYEFDNIGAVNKAKTGDMSGGVRRPITWTDLLYQIIVDVVQDKHVYLTRHPVTNMQNIYPAKVKVMSTVKDREVWLYAPNSHVDDLEFAHYKKYPLVEFEGNPRPYPQAHKNFMNVMLSGNLVLAALGGDYDGDMLYMRGVFTQEANIEADKLIYSKTNLLNASGGPSRAISKIGKEAAVAMYELTKEG